MADNIIFKITKLSFKKMKNFLRIVPYVFLTFSILFCTYFWDKIFLLFDNSDIIGTYTNNKYHSLNDLVRYLFFIFIPTISWIVSYLLFNKKKLKNLFTILII